MARFAKGCLQITLKVVNSVMGLMGIAMLMYGLWMFRVWQRDIEEFHFDSSAPWFIYSFLSVGVTLCLITGIGHISADSSNSFCLSCVSFLGPFCVGGCKTEFLLAVFPIFSLCFYFCHHHSQLLLILHRWVLGGKTAIAADILLNSDWEKDLPEDPTGRLHDFKEFVKSNFDFFKWIGLLVVLAQGSSILLAMALKALGTNHGCCNYDSDDECKPTRLPLINHNLQPSPFVLANPQLTSKIDAFNASKLRK